MTAYLIVKAIPWLLGLMGLFGLYQRGKHNGKVDAHRETLERYHKTRKAMDDVETGDSPDDARRWLRERGQ